MLIMLRILTPYQNTRDTSPGALMHVRIDAHWREGKYHKFIVLKLRCMAAEFISSATASNAKKA
jgi:hypothetical protein